MKQSPYQLLMGVVLLGTVAFLSWQAGGLAQPGCSIYSQKMDPESKNRRLL